LTKPLIGITTAVLQKDNGSRYYTGYAPIVNAVEQAGGLPMLIPSESSPETLRALYERADGVLIPGGGDVHASFYGEDVHPKAMFIDQKRDEAEIALARWAAEDTRPLFAICRGHQVINVALGGGLLQDIPSMVQTDLKHDYTPDEAPRSLLAHDVNVDPDSRLAQIIGKTQLTVNSLHHQSVTRVGTGLKVTAHATDGVIEGTELPGDSFYLSVQWHPEDITHIDEMAKLFSAFVDAARDRYISGLNKVG